MADTRKGAGTPRFTDLKRIPTTRVFVPVVEALVDYIDRNALKSGDRLLGEGQIAEALGVSRPSLRQALRILESAGVVRVKTGNGGGIFVAADVIPLNLIHQSMEAEGETLANLLISRHLIEPTVMHLAAERATRDDLDLIETSIRLMESGGSRERRVSLDGMYHRRVAYASHDDLLIRTIVALYRRMLPLRLDDEEVDPSAEHMAVVHSRQLEAIRQRDHELIDDLIRESFVDFEQSMGISFPYDVIWRRRGDR